MWRGFLIVGLAALAACTPLSLPHPLPDVLILGEQHDAPSHQRLHREAVETLARQHELAGVALEMAESGRTTAGLPSNATQADVRSALAWDEKGWPWADYGPVVMEAVRAGVPVIGANLPRAQLKAAGEDASLDDAVPPSVLQAQIDDVREGHCGLLPETQLRPLARIQVARDRSLARGVASLVQPGKAAVLVTGGHHADPENGVPLHLPHVLRSVSKIWPPQPPAQDYCAQLREQWKKR